MDDTNVIVILGHQRSGTTLLNKVLSAHRGVVFMEGEFNDFPFYRDKEQWYANYGARKYEIMARDFFSRLDVPSPLAPVDYRDFHQCKNFSDWLLTILSYYRSHDGFVGFKIADHFKKNVALISECLPNSRCIHIIRDPRDIYVSWRKTHFGMSSPYIAGVSWSQAINAATRLSGLVSHYYEIRYEQLIQYPRQQLKLLCDFLGIPFIDDLLTFYRLVDDNGPHQRLLQQGFVATNRDKWKTEMTAGELRLLVAGTGETIHTLGYGDGSKIPVIFWLEKIWQHITNRIVMDFKFLRSHRSREFKRRLYKIRIFFSRWLMGRKFY